ncbi:hypothetical protein [Cyanobium sp. ATX-6F1]|uniref:hypothetical protein n=1 Tax=Cyanobium sp. ATX-6F1 TaxID=3137388 RepID=UPI0039BE8AC6
MQRSNTWIWLLLAALLLLAPGPLGRFVLDLVGGITLVLLLLPLLLGAAGFVAWQVIQKRLLTCPACGFTSMATDSCPACGTPFGDGINARSPVDQLDVSNVTIDVEVVEDN